MWEMLHPDEEKCTGKTHNGAGDALLLAAPLAFRASRLFYILYER